MADAPLPIPTPCRLHPILPTGRVHLRQPFQRTRPLTESDQGGKLLNVGEGLANGMETTVETGALDLRFGGPKEAVLVMDALEFELLDEHQNSIATLMQNRRASVRS